MLAQHCGDLAPAVDPAQLDLPTQYEAEEQDQRRGARAWTAAAPFGWRYGSALALGPEERVAPLAAPGANVTVADLLS